MADGSPAVYPASPSTTAILLRRPPRLRQRTRDRDELLRYRDHPAVSARSRIQPDGTGGSSYQRWFAIGGSNGVIHVVGDSRRIASRSTDGGWSLTSNPATGLDLYAVTGRWPHEGLAAGREDPALPALRFGSSGWHRAPEIEPYFDVYALWAAGDNEYFAAGQLRNSVGGVVGGEIVRGRR